MSRSPFQSGHASQNEEDVSSPREQLPIGKILKQSAWTEDEVTKSQRCETSAGSSDEVETSFVQVPLADVEVNDGRHHLRDRDQRHVATVHHMRGTSSQAAASLIGASPLRTISRLSTVDEHGSQSTPLHSSVKSCISEESPLRDDSQRQARETLSVGSCRWSGEDESSPDRSRSATSQSDTRSYRDRLRERFHAVKEQVGSALAETQIRSRVRRRMVVRSTTPRVDEQLKKEEEEVLAALEKHERARARWQDAAEQVSSPQLPNDGVIYDFFTQVWQDEQQQPTQQSGSTPSSPKSDTGNGDCDGEQEKLLATEVLGLQSDWELLCHKSAECTDLREQLSKEQALLFCPSSDPVPLEEKLRPGCEPRYLEDEGLYVGSKPPVTRRNRNRLEQRLIAEGNMKWFGDDGEVLALPDPRQQVSCNIPAFTSPHQTKDVEYRPAELGSLDSRACVLPSDGQFLLELEVVEVVFSHHPLFSREHVLARRLQEQYQRYVQRAVLGREKRLAGKLEALRRARDNLRVLGDLLPEQAARLNRYREEIRETRRQWQQEGRYDRQLLSGLLRLWRDMKRLREAQGYACTPVRLHIGRERCEDQQLEQQLWDERVRQETEELVEELRQLHQTRMDEYWQQLALWKRKRKAMREACSRRQRAAEERIEDPEHPEEVSEDVEKEERLEGEPQPPAEVDVVSVAAGVVEQLKESMRPPGEPVLHLELTYSLPVDQNPPANNERARRAAVRHHQLYVKIIFNGSEACISESQPLNDRFTVTLEEVFPICIVQLPECLKIELHEEENTFRRHLIAEVYVPIPSSMETLHNSKLMQLEFNNTQVVMPSHAGVGSGIYFSPFPEGSSLERECFYTSGYISCRAGWGVDGSEGKILAVPDKYLVPSRETYKTDVMDLLESDGPFEVAKLREWVEKSHLDPNDPNNAAFFNIVKTAATVVAKEPGYFRLDPLQFPFDFCTAEELDNNSRLRLLRLRYKGEPEFRGVRMVPLNEKEIPSDVFSVYEKRQSGRGEPADTVLDPLDAHRAWGRKFLLEVRQRVFRQCRRAQQHRELRDMVTEDLVPDIGTLGLTFVKWLQPKRPLRPVRKERRAVTVQSLAGAEVKIIVNVVQAFQVPSRRDMDTLGSIMGIQTQQVSTTPVVRPFVEVSFQEFVTRTTTADGSSPTWNQELQIPVRAPGGGSSTASWQCVHDSLFLHLFDEVVVDLVADDRLRQTNVHHRLERTWLGSLQIPFIALYYNPRIEGTFRLQCPAVLLGYERESHHSHFFRGTGSPETETDVRAWIPARDSTFITLFITLQPSLNPPKPIRVRLESSELAHVEHHLEAWDDEIAKLFPDRKVKTTVVDTSGKTVCVTRFFKPLPPPVISEGEITTPQMAARFVSMIPVVAGSMLFPGLFDIWLTSDQVLQLLTGDSEDHAVLLCCYFLHMGKQAWVLLGQGIPHGPTAYVLTAEEAGQYHLWDPVTSHCYNIADSFCPLQKVYCVISDKNVWANMQREELPCRTRYDTSRHADWLPAFSPDILAPGSSVQPLALEYAATSATACQQLRDRLEKHLRDCLMRWRRTTRTLWNRYCTAILRKLLPTLEEAAWNKVQPTSPEHMQQLQHILASHKVYNPWRTNVARQLCVNAGTSVMIACSYSKGSVGGNTQMCGFPINMPYVDINAVTAAVKATGVHFNERPDVEFALAVHIHPFPNNVISVWVYVASLTKRR